MGDDGKICPPIISDSLEYWSRDVTIIDSISWHFSLLTEKFILRKVTRTWAWEMAALAALAEEPGFNS